MDKFIGIVIFVVIFGIGFMSVGALLEENCIVKSMEKEGYVVLNEKYFKLVPVEVGLTYNKEGLYK